MKKNISIVVFAHNNIDYTINTINSLFENTTNCSKYNYIFNIYDDCSTDNTENYFKSNFTNINYIRQNQNKGFNYLCNLAYSNNKSNDFLVLLNNDLKFSNNWLKIILDEMETNNATAGGPITNAPGHQPKQNIRKFLKEYKINDANKNINEVSKKLKNKKSFTASFLNGFCMVYDINWLNTLSQPIFDYNDPNFGLEKKFFGKHSCDPLIIPSSFVFHYKQVTVNRNDWAKHHFRLFDSTKKYKIAIGIITYKRYKLLKKTIVSLVKQNINQPFDIFIVDNDISRSAKNIISINTPEHINIFYNVEEKKGIPFARNKIVELINENYDYLAFIDDDEVADEKWLSSLLSSIIKYNADVVAGPVTPIINTKLPKWIKDGDFLRTRKTINKTGDIIKRCGTGNVIINCNIFNSINPPFDLRFKNMGGSDEHFFKKLISKGYRIKWSNDAKAYEHINKERLNIKWNLMRSYRIGNSKLFSFKLNKDYKKIFSITLTSIIQIFLLICLIPFALVAYFCGHKRFFLKEIKNFMKCLGVVTSLLGFMYQDYK